VAISSWDEYITQHVALH